jgi:hypothetical protein
MWCLVASRLLRRYARAIGVLREAQQPLLQGLLAPGPDYRKGREKVIQTNAAVDAARRDFWLHIQKHECSDAGRTDYSKATKERLREQMRQARELFDNASEKYDHLAQLIVECAGTPDRGMRLDQAQIVPMRAFEVYSEALRRYADYVVFGTLPEVPATEVAAKSKPN